MAKRRISEAEIEDALEEPDITYPGRTGAMCYVRNIGDRRIKVVAEGSFVITVADQKE
jgi:hypothetical protein